MSPELSAKFDQLDQRMEAMIAKIHAYPADKLNAPVGKSLSPSLALEHMAITEGIYNKMINAEVAAKMAGKTAKTTIFYNFIMKALLKPAGQTAFMPGMFAPSGSVDLESAATQWRESRAKLRAFLTTVDDNAPCGGNLLEGRLSPTHVYDLLNCHQDYHDARLP